MRPLLLLALALSAMFTLAVGLARAAAHDPHAAQTVDVAFATFDGCERPCFVGIAPGMSVIEASRILHDHGWTTDVRVRNNRITWAWSGAQPAFIDATERGSVQVFWDIVRSVSIPTHLRYGDVLLAADPPLYANYMIRTGSVGVNHVIYHDQFVLHRYLTCPVPYSTMWAAPLVISLDWRSADEDVLARYEYDVHAAVWWSGRGPCSAGRVRR
jgi:hypothetical protein